MSTDRGLAYLQYSHHHPEFGELVRVLPGLYDARPTALDELARQPERFFTFYPLKAAVADGSVAVIVNAQLPPDTAAFPVMRASSGAAGGRRADWWLWDGMREWRIGELSPEQRRYSIRRISNHAMLRKRVAEGWIPEHEY